MILLPGSTLAIEACKKGYPAGLVKIKNPGNETGYVQVGGPRFIGVLREFADGSKLINIDDMQHFVAQGGMYGLGPIYYKYGIDVKMIREKDGSARYATSYDVSDLRNLYKNRGFISSVQLYYRENLTNPDQKAKGFAHWVKDYKTFNQRRGLTAFPLRSPSGVPVKGAAFSPQQGHCNYYGSGPGVSGTSSDPFGFRFTKRARSYKPSGRLRRWSPIARDPAAPNVWYVCGNTPSYTVNPNRSVYDKGQSRGIDEASLVQALDDTAQQDTLKWASSKKLNELYSDFAFHPEKYKANPLFIRSGLGFNLGVPKDNINTMVEKGIISKDQRDSLKGKSLSRFWKRLSTADDVGNAIAGTDIGQKIIDYPDEIINIATTMEASPAAYYY